VGVLVLALLPVAPSLGASWIAEDASILGYVDRHGPFSDWASSQYGLELVRFWRPLVTTSWWFGERAFGMEPSGLRLLNVAGHLLATLLAARIARAAGASVRAGFLAAALIASFPEVGGTVTWLAGRTDVLCAALMLAAVWSVLRGWALVGALASFAACATKEFAFVLPLWAAAFLWARGADRRAFVRGFLAVLCAALAAFVWRRLALGGFQGGYLLATRDLGAMLPEVPRAIGSLAVALGAFLPALLVLGGLGWAAGSLSPRLFLAGLVAGAAALVPLLPLVRHAPLEEQNLRLLFVAETGFAFAAAGAFAREPRRGIALALALAVGFVLVGWRSGRGLADVLEWREAGAIADRVVARTLDAVRSARSADHPVLAAGFPRAWRGAYCLGWGAADRFRAPFEVAPRPVWPLRAMFPATPERPLAVAARADGTAWPFDDSPVVALLALRDEAGGEPVRLELDERSFQSVPDRSPRLAFGPFEGALRIEVVAYTELGYASALLGGPGSGETSLMRILSAADTSRVATIGDALLQARDVGATRAFLELRAVGAEGALLAASPWIEVAWDPALRNPARPGS